MFGRVGEAIRESLRKLISRGYIDEKTLDSFLDELKKDLLQADVEITTVKEFIKEVREKVLKEKDKGFSIREVVIPIVYEELVKLVGEGEKIEVREKPFKILLVGLFGSGKTTTAGKLALFFSKRGYKVCLVCLDVFRPAAYEQLEQLAKKVKVGFLGDPNEKDPVKLVRKFEGEFEKYDVVIFDSSGRDALDESMIKEITSIERELRPQEVILVMSADIGQQAKEEANAFHEALKITGVIVTKLDGTAKGGGAIVACKETKAKIKFVGTGEHLEDLEEFEPKRFISRLIGLGDLETLLKKAKEVIKEEKAEELKEKMTSGKLSLIDFYEQLRSVQQMGSLSKLMTMIPGLPLMKLPKDILSIQEEKMKKFIHIMDSMTKEELENPDIINASRISRIAKGAGVTEGEVRELLTQYNQMRKLMKGLGSGDLRKLMKRFGGLGLR